MTIMQGIIVPGGVLILAVSFIVAWLTGARRFYLLVLSAAYIALAIGFCLMLLRGRFSDDLILPLANGTFILCQVLLGEALLERRGKSFGLAGNAIAFVILLAVYCIPYFLASVEIRTIAINTGLFLYMLIVISRFWIHREDTIHDKMIFCTLVVLGVMHIVRTLGLLYTNQITAPGSIFWQFLQMYSLLLAMVLALEVLAAHFVESLNNLNSLRDRDHLTGVLNRAGFDRAVSSFYHERTDTVLSLTLLDIDNFKTINDSRGHPAGDRVLMTFGQILLNQSRGTDVVGRIGGDEFAIFSVGLDNLGALAMAERISAHFRENAMSALGGDTPFTCSAGVATMRVERGYEALYALTDSALYSAKRLGRNRVVSGNRGPGIERAV
ncbi:GGDEF domain-containing protein [Martelella limonii]|uniref:GGDEF domain-containing protein n=1 Tax=Martelella limonii TaxID=1647649 RepID=UPI00158129A0|nr:GGDEF domain-containing protein [Martelella limonii]